MNPWGWYFRGQRSSLGHSRSVEVILKHHKDQWKNPYYQHRDYFIRNNVIFYRTGIPDWPCPMTHRRWVSKCFILDGWIPISVVLYFLPSKIKLVWFYPDLSAWNFTAQQKYGMIVKFIDPWYRKLITVTWNYLACKRSKLYRCNKEG